MSYCDGFDGRWGDSGVGGGETAPTPPTVATFRATFPQFAAVPDAAVSMYLTLAISSCRYAFWQDRINTAILLFTAHYVASTAASLAATTPAQAAAASAGSGVVSSKSVGGVSKSYDTSAGQTDGGGTFNTTIFGQQYLTMRESGSLGALQL